MKQKFQNCQGVLMKAELYMHDFNFDLSKFFPKLKEEIKELRPTQKEIISSIMCNGNTLGIMQTGGGKSLAYWLSGLKMGGITIVISPLIALITEQAEKIREHGYEVLELHSGIDAMKQTKLLKDFANKELNPRFIFLSPEKIAIDGLLEEAVTQRKNDTKLIVIDEVHCVSQWGMNFRPFYQRIPDFLNTIYGESRNWPRILALTATVNTKELNDICNYFKIDKFNIIRQELSMRNEIQLHVEKCINEVDKKTKFWNIVNCHQNEKTLVYVYRKYAKNGVIELCEEAQDKGIKADYFHGDLTSKERQTIIEKFKNNELTMIFATNAFGMGIDIPDIRVVIHYMIPESCEQYYQEIGRAARDGNSANAYLLYSDKNIDVKSEYFINKSFPTEETLKEIFLKIRQNKTGLCTFDYFADDEQQYIFPYFIEAGLIEIICKGFARLSCMENIKDNNLQKYYDSTVAKLFISTVKETNTDPKELAKFVYKSYINNKFNINKAFEKTLILNILYSDISNNQMQRMLDSIDKKKQYKHELLDYFVSLLERCENQQELHQEIALYLGTDKYQLNRIYTTLDGNKVRSKSEVIICNELFNSHIKYEYEKKLYYSENKWIEPDFTIKLSNSELYWEHLGMLGKDDYDSRWSRKIDIYNKYFPNRLIKTYESGVLSKDVKTKIDEIKNMQLLG